MRSDHLHEKNSTSSDNVVLPSLLLCGTRLCFSPEAPTFRPTMEEFSDPIRYLSSSVLPCYFYRLFFCFSVAIVSTSVAELSCACVFVDHMPKNRISQEAFKFGICKIIPPKEWKLPPPSLNKTHHFKTRLQELHQLQASS